MYLLQVPHFSTLFIIFCIYLNNRICAYIYIYIYIYTHAGPHIHIYTNKKDAYSHTLKYMLSLTHIYIYICFKKNPITNHGAI